MKGFLKRNDPSPGVCGDSRQTALQCFGQNPWYWTDKEKAHQWIRYE